MKDWKPTPKQARVYNCRKKYINCLGEPRSGKSETFFYKIRREIFFQPGIKVLITRDSGTPLLGTTFKHFFEKKIFTYDMIINGKDGIAMKPFPVIPFKNGSIVEFKPYDEMDTTKAGGSEYGIVLIEEAHRFVRLQWEYMDTRLSQQWGNAINPDGSEYQNPITYKGLWTTQNPAGRGYLYQIFTREHPLAIYDKDEKYRLFKFYLKDNERNLDPEYVKDMYSKPEHIRRKLLGASEDPSEGLVFPEFDQNIVVFKVGSKGWGPPPHYRVIGGEDYGYQTTACFYWACVTDEPAFIIVFREYRTNHKTIPELCKEIVAETKKIHANGASWIDTARIDPSTNMKDGKSIDAKTVYELHKDQPYMDFLLPARRQKVMDRVGRMRDMLAPDPLKQYHPITNEFRPGGWPTLIITSDCEGLITEIEDWELKEMTTREKTVEIPEEKGDHGPDAVSYLLQAFCGDASPENETTREMRENTPAERIKKQIMADVQRSMTKGDPVQHSGDQVL